MTNTKIALVTGANKGIGKEIARQLAGLGMTVLVGARDTERGEKAAAELRADGTDVRFLRLDVADDASVAAAAGAIDSTFGRLDVLVNNAGQQHPDKDIRDITVEQLQRMAAEAA